VSRGSTSAIGYNGLGNRHLMASKLRGGLENRRDCLRELGWSLLRRDVGSCICPEGSGVFRPNGLPLPVRNIG
jgi:hypothetical protein